MENKGLVVQSETVGFEVRCFSVWLSRLNGPIQSAPLLPIVLPPPALLIHTHTHSYRDSVALEWRPGGERGTERWGIRELVLQLRAAEVEEE